MKKLLLISFTLLLNVAIGQESTFLSYWEEYHNECSQTVTDTLMEEGWVHYSLALEDDVLKVSQSDTAWEEVECQKYKEENLIYSIGDLYVTSYVREYQTLEFRQENLYFKVTREKICTMKLREPTFVNFWLWLEEKGYRE